MKVFIFSIFLFVLGDISADTEIKIIHAVNANKCNRSFNMIVDNINDIDDVIISNNRSVIFRISIFSIFSIGKNKSELEFKLHIGDVLELRMFDELSESANQYQFCGYDENYIYIVEYLKTKEGASSSDLKSIYLKLKIKNKGDLTKDLNIKI